MDNAYYDKFFGKDIVISIYPSQEPIQNSNWVIYYFNSISSIAYISNSIIIFMFCNNLCIISYLGSIISFLLGIASFFWWASQRDYVQRIDVGLYSSLIFWPSFMALSHNNQELEFTITNIYFISTLVLIYLCFDLGLNTKYITILNCVGLFYSIYLVSNLINDTNITIFLYAIAITLIGFVIKLSDTYRLLNPNLCGPGTGWFHLFTALGLLLVWYGFQLFPIKNNLNY